MNYINAYGCDAVDSEYTRIAKNDTRPRYVDVFSGRMYLFYCDSPASLPYLSSFVFVSFVVLTGFMLISLTVAAVSDGVHLRLLEIQKQKQEEEEYDEDEELLEDLLDAEVPESSAVVTDERKEQLVNRMKNFALKKSQTAVVLREKLKEQQETKVNFVPENSSCKPLTEAGSFREDSKNSEGDRISRLQSLTEEGEDKSFHHVLSGLNDRISSKASNASVEDSQVVDYDQSQESSIESYHAKKIKADASSSNDSADMDISRSKSFSSRDSGDLSIMPSRSEEPEIVIRVVTIPNDAPLEPKKLEFSEKSSPTKIEDKSLATVPSAPSSPSPGIRKTISSDGKSLKVKATKSGIPKEKLPLIEDEELIRMMLTQMWKDVEKEKEKLLKSPSLDDSSDDKQSPHSSSKLSGIMPPQESVRSLSSSPHFRSSQRPRSFSDEDLTSASSSKKFAYLFRNIMATYLYMLYIIFIVVITAGIEIYCTNNDNCRDYWEVFVVVQILLTLDILLRILTYYPTYKTFFFSHLNLIDLSMVLILWIPIFYRGYGANVAGQFLFATFPHLFRQ